MKYRTTDSTRPHCDVVIPYHEPNFPFVFAAIDSVLQQQDATCVVHVVADGVDEKMYAAVQTLYRDISNIHFYHNKKSIGPYQSLHTIFHALETQYIAIQDSDDIALPHRINYSINAMKTQNASIGGFAARHILDTESAEDTKLLTLMEDEPVAFSGIINDAYPYGRVLNCTMVVSKSVFFSLNGFAEWFCGCDAEFVARAQKAGVGIATDSEVVLLRRLHSDSISTNRSTGMGTSYRENILKEMHRRFHKFTPGFNPRQYGCLDTYLSPVSSHA